MLNVQLYVLCVYVCVYVCMYVTAATVAACVCVFRLALASAFISLLPLLSLTLSVVWSCSAHLLTQPLIHCCSCCWMEERVLGNCNNWLVLIAVFGSVMCWSMLASRSTSQAVFVCLSRVCPLCCDHCPHEWNELKGQHRTPDSNGPRTCNTTRPHTQPHSAQTLHCARFARGTQARSALLGWLALCSGATAGTISHAALERWIYPVQPNTRGADTTHCRRCSLTVKAHSSQANRQRPHTRLTGSRACGLLIQFDSV